MKSYTPYENVAAKPYPPILAETSPQRHPGALRRAGQVGGEAARAPPPTARTCCSRPRWPPATAALSGRYNAWKDRAFSYAWVLDRAGLRLSAA